MKMKTKMEIGRRILLLSSLLYFMLLFMARSAAYQSTSTTTFLGISPEDEMYYKALSNNNAINCKDGSNKFYMSQLNDDFCDCPDGSDEPGTSACPTGKFYCQNAGHTPLTLYSSRVNDGICDCCDGSDEYNSKVKCPNTCWEAGKVARDKLKKKIATYQEGVTIRKRDVEQAKEAIAKDEAELSRLKSEEKVLKGLVEQLKERKEQIEKAEEKERMQKEKEERERREAEEAKSRETKAGEKADIPEESNAINSADTPPEEPIDSSIHDKVEDSPMDVEEDHHKSVDETEHSDNSINDVSPESKIEQHTTTKEEEHAGGDESGLDAGSKSEDAENTKSLSREELGRRVASQWVRQESVKEAEDVGANADDLETHDELPADTHDDEYNGYNSEDSYEDDDVDDNDHPEDLVEDFKEEDHSGSSTSYKPESDDESDLSGTEAGSTSNPSWLEKIQQTVRSIIQAVNIFQAPVNISEAAHVRKEYEESNDRLTKIQSRISKLTKKLKHDFGPEKEFYSFFGQCFESKQNKYVYKICPFKEATQEEGHSRTRLGSWDKFEDNYKIMQFSNGDKCWNGPDRSLKVKLRCGLRIEVSDVDEPSRCEYWALLSTPALCLEDKLKELQDKLDLMNREQPRNHDEL